jgi:hypothetical protein
MHTVNKHAQSSHRTEFFDAAVAFETALLSDHERCNGKEAQIDAGGRDLLAGYRHAHDAMKRD